jgi:hypothetical protein
MSRTNDLTGEWSGSYSQAGTRKAIRATLEQSGNRLSGQMTDVERVTEKSLFESVAASGLPPGADEAIAAQIHELIPNEPIGPITVVSILPEFASIKGGVNVPFVSFTKAYLEPSVWEYRMGNSSVKRTSPPHEVAYSGRISDDGGMISGQWHIVTHQGRADGSFELKRVV